jgi:hypothetical protein
MPSNGSPCECRPAERRKLLVARKVHMDVIAQANDTTADNPWIPSARWERLTNAGTLAGLVAAFSGAIIAFFPWAPARAIGSLLVAGGVLTMLILPAS